MYSIEFHDDIRKSEVSKITDYISFFKKEFSDLNAEEIRSIKSIEMVFEAQQDAYDFIKLSLNMKNKKFEAFKNSEEFGDEWNRFCEAEKQFISQL